MLKGMLGGMLGGVMEGMMEGMGEKVVEGRGVVERVVVVREKVVVERGVG